MPNKNEYKELHFVTYKQNFKNAQVFFRTLEYGNVLGTQQKNNNMGLKQNGGPRPPGAPKQSGTTRGRGRNVRSPKSLRVFWTHARTFRPRPECP